MEYFAVALFSIGVIGIPIAVLLYNDYGKKRGCGRGCATSGNRFLCHPDQYSDKPEQIDKKETSG